MDVVSIPALHAIGNVEGHQFFHQFVVGETTSGAGSGQFLGE
jgi:hypothetical protein